MHAPLLPALFTRYVALAERRAGWLLSLLALLGALALFPVSRLELHTDLSELLPDQHPAVVALRQVSARQISSTNLVVLLSSPDPQANRRLAEALRPALSVLVPEVFSEIEWRPDTEVADFSQRWRWLYADRADLVAAEDLLDRLVAQRSSPLAVDLEGDAEAELRALRARLNQRLPERREAPYFEGPDAQVAGLHHLGIMLWRRGGGLASMGDHEILQSVRGVVGRAGPATFHPQMRVEYTGPVAMAIEEQDAVRDDLTLATAVCVTLVLGVIYLYFRRLAVLAVVGAPALLGVLLSLALARYAIRYLNANTAFLISIILGNGINSPIILLARYGEERRRGLEVSPALERAMSGTLLATLTAMAAASIAYGCLLLTSLQGLNQFGLVGGAGMLLVWILTFVLVPPAVHLGERLRPGLMTPPQVSAALRAPLTWLGRVAARAPALLGAVVLVALGAAAIPAVRFARSPLEYDLSKLRTTEPDAQRRWDIMYALGMGNVGAGHIGRDGVLLVDAPEQAQPVADALWQKDQALGDRHVLEAVRTLRTVLPAEQAEKLAILSRLRQKIDRHLAHLDEEERREVKEWRPPEALRPLTVTDLPRRIRLNFTEVDGTIGRLIGIDADPARYGEGDGRGLIRLSRSLNVEALGKTWVAASISTVFAGMIETIQQDGPKVSLAALVGVALLLVCAFGLRGAGPVLLSLLAGLFGLCGILGALGLKLNFVNFVALPITLGVGADYAANLWARLAAEGVGRLEVVVAETGSAVALCSLTTIIGYSSLLLARNRALQTFGQVADLGEVTCLLCALCALPALSLLARRPK